jgi:hypothetical protein
MTCDSPYSIGESHSVNVRLAAHDILKMFLNIWSNSIFKYLQTVSKDYLSILARNADFPTFSLLMLIPWIILSGLCNSMAGIFKTLILWVYSHSLHFKVISRILHKLRGNFCNNICSFAAYVFA